jgi:hypothetical protein
LELAHELLGVWPEAQMRYAAMQAMPERNFWGRQRRGCRPAAAVWRAAAQCQVILA